MPNLHTIKFFHSNTCRRTRFLVCPASQPFILLSFRRKKKTTKGPNWFSFWSVRQPASVQAYIKMRHKAAWPVPFLIPPMVFFLALCLFHKGRDYNSKKGVKKYNLHMKQNDNLLVAAAGWLAEAWSRWCVPKTVWRVLHVLLLDYNTIKEHRNKNNNNIHERYRKGNWRGNNKAGI